MTLLVPMLGAAGILIAAWGVVGSRPGFGDRVAPYVDPRHTGGSDLHRVLRSLPEPLASLVRGETDRRALQPLITAVSGAVLMGLAGAAQGVARAASGAIAGGIIGWCIHRSIVVRHRRQRGKEIREQLPTALDLMSIALTAGEAVGPALVRIGPYLGGTLADLMTDAAARIQAGVPVGEAFDEMTRQEDEPALARFVETITTALDRGAPLAQTLQSHSYELREEERRDLLDAGGRREVLMLVPVVFLILPVVVVFVLYPGLVSLNMLVP